MSRMRSMAVLPRLSGKRSGDSVKADAEATQLYIHSNGRKALRYLMQLSTKQMGSECRWIITWERVLRIVKSIRLLQAEEMAFRTRVF